MVVHSLNHNNIGRVYPFLQAFVGSPDVQITVAGWDTTGTLFPLLANLPWPIIRLQGPTTGPAARKALTALPPCDIIHCFKNQSHFQAVLAVARERDVPLVLDLDDWELGLYLEGMLRWSRLRQALWGWSIAGHIRSYLALETLARTAPAALLVNSSALKAHFGGEIVYTAADAVAFDPRHLHGNRFRQAHGIPLDAPVIGFLGTPHAHKGIDELLAAFGNIRRHNANTRLLFVGVPRHNKTYARLCATPGVTVVDYIAAGDYPDAYAACDVVAIPQRAVTEGIMQTPAKLILAMATGRPIVATTVGDMPDLLGDAGIFVPPRDRVALEEALTTFLEQPTLRAERGAAARARFMIGLTLHHLRDRMLTIYKRVVLT